MRYVFADISTLSIDESLNLAQNSLLTLLESNDSDAVLGAVKKLIFNLLGLVPGGALFPGLYDIYQIANSRKDRTVKANSYLDELDSFLFSAFQWCTATQLLVDLICAMEKDKLEGTPLPVDGAITRVTARFEGMVNALKGERDA